MTLFEPQSLCREEVEVDGWAGDKLDFNTGDSFPVSK